MRPAGLRSRLRAGAGCERLGFGVHDLRDNSMRGKLCSGYSQRSIVDVHMILEEYGAPSWPAVQAACRRQVSV